MDLKFDQSYTTGYHSSSQIARVLTENWICSNMYCPRCGNRTLRHFENNRPVADFYCPICQNEYELKSKQGNSGKKIPGGAYDAMIQRITSNKHPDFFFMNYSMETFSVKDLIFIPKHFFLPEIIEKRKPLAPTARRAGWIGCNILLDKIPSQGRIPIIISGTIVDRDTVFRHVNQTMRLDVQDLDHRSWIMDILNCINRIESEHFTLNHMYAFEKELQEKHPCNHNIRPKIRQQLQLLRDKDLIQFLGNGTYQKLI